MWKATTGESNWELETGKCGSIPLFKNAQCAHVMPVSIWNLKVLTERRYFIISEISSLNEWCAAVHVFTRFRNVPKEPSKGIGTAVVSASDCPWQGAAHELLAVSTALLHPKEDGQTLWVCVSVLLDVLRGCCPTTGSKGQDFQK